MPFRYGHAAHPSKYGELSRQQLLEIYINRAFGIHVDLGRASARHTKAFLTAAEAPGSDFALVQQHTYATILARHQAVASPAQLEGRQLHLHVDNLKADVTVHPRAVINTIDIGSNIARGKVVDWGLLAHFPNLLADVAVVGPAFHEAAKVQPPFFSIDNLFLFSLSAHCWQIKLFVKVQQLSYTTARPDGCLSFVCQHCRDGRNTCIPATSQILKFNKGAPVYSDPEVRTHVHCRRCCQIC